MNDLIIPRPVELESSYNEIDLFKRIDYLIPFCELDENETRISARQEICELLDKLCILGNQLQQYGQWLLVASWDIVDSLVLWEDMGLSNIIEYAKTTIIQSNGWGFRTSNVFVPSDITITAHLRVFRFWHKDVGVNLFDMSRFGYAKLLAAMPFARMFIKQGNIVHPLLIETLNDPEVPAFAIQTVFLNKLTGNTDALATLDNSQKSFVQRAIRKQIKDESGLPSLDYDRLSASTQSSPIYVLDITTGALSSWFMNQSSRKIEACELARFYFNGKTDGNITQLVNELKEKGLNIELMTGEEMKDYLYGFLVALETML